MDAFFTTTFNQSLDRLKPDTEPKWGSLTASGMLDHVRRALWFSINPSKAQITTPSEKLPAYKRFLMSEKPFAPNLNQPKDFDNIEPFTGDFEAQKEELKRTLEQVITFLNQHPDFTSNHPSFGALNPTEWLHLHKKHVKHHFTQFGLL